MMKLHLHTLLSLEHEFIYTEQDKNFKQLYKAGIIDTTLDFVLHAVTFKCNYTTLVKVIIINDIYVFVRHIQRSN